MPVILVLVCGLSLFQDETPIERAVRQLRSHDPEDRAEAMEQLKKAGGKARKQLEAIAGDPDPEVAIRVKELRHHIEVSELVPDRLKTAVPGLADRIAAGKEDAWTEGIQEALRLKETGEAQHPHVRIEDLEILAIHALKEAGVTRNHMMRWASYGVRFNPESLIKLVNEDNVEKQAGALYALERQVEQKPLVSALIKLLKHPSSGVRIQVVRILGRRKAGSAIPELTKLLKEKPESPGNPGVAGYALEVLGELQAREAVPQIRILLKDPNPHIRTRAARALGRLGVKEAIPEIAELLDDKFMSTAVVLALGDLDAVDLAPRLVPLLSEPYYRSSVGVTLRKLNARNVVPQCVELLASEKAETRSAVLLLLAELNARDRIEDVSKYIEDPSPQVQWSAVKALRLLGVTEEEKTLRKLLKEGDLRLRFEIIRYCRDHGIRSAVPELLERVEENTADSGMAAQALGVLQAKSARDALVKLIKAAKPYPARQAAQGLCELGYTDGVSTILEKSNTSSSFFHLNALRSPKAWKELSRMPCGLSSPGIKGPAETILEKLSKRARMRLKPPAFSSWKERLDWRSGWSTSLQGKESTVLDVLQKVASILSSYRLELVLEPGVLRVLSRKDARVYWEKWASEK